MSFVDKIRPSNAAESVKSATELEGYVGIGVEQKRKGNLQKCFRVAMGELKSV